MGRYAYGCKEGAKAAGHRQAKADAGNALRACAHRLGVVGLRPHLPAVWAGLRGELLAAGEAGFSNDDSGRAMQRAVAAAACLEDIVHALALGDVPSYHTLQLPIRKFVWEVLPDWSKGQLLLVRAI